MSYAREFELDRLQAENAKLRAALFDLAVRAHIRLGSGGWTAPNGYSCKLCKAECGPHAALEHADSCLLASVSTTSGTGE